MRERVRELALEEPELSPRELAWQITDRESWCISESSGYRILKRYDLITSSAYVVLSAGGVTATLDLAVTKTGVTQVLVRHRPRLLSDNGL